MIDVPDVSNLRTLEEFYAAGSAYLRALRREKSRANLPADDHIFPVRPESSMTGQRRHLDAFVQS